MNKEINLTLENEVDVCLPQVIAAEEKRKAEELVRETNEQTRISNEENREKEEVKRTQEMSNIKMTVKAVSEEQANLQEQLNVEKARIDLLNTLEEGSTTGDAELVDGRISVDGSLYNNIGNAIRGQVQQIYENIDENKVSIIKNKAQFIQGSIVNGVHGNSNTRIHTPIFYELKNNKIKVSVKAGYKYTVVYYNGASEDDFVVYKGWYTEQKELDFNYPYARFTVAKSDDTATSPSSIEDDVITVEYESTSQVNKNKKDIEILSPITLKNQKYNFNLYNELTIKENYYSAENGKIGASIYHDCSDYIKVNGGEVIKYCLRGSSDKHGLIVFYDTNKNFVEAGAIGNGYTKNVEGAYTVPAEGYVTFSNRNDFLDGYVYFEGFIPYIIQNELNKKKGVLTIPSYWENEITDSISKIQEHELVTDSQGDSFVFITDTHWPSNAKKSPALIKKIIDNTNVKKVFCGGDIINLHSTKNEALTLQRDFVKTFRDLDIDILNVLGNHDLNNNQATYGSEAYLNINEVYSTLFKSAEEKLNGMPKISETNGDSNRNMFYYIDNPVQKIRYIVLNNARSKIYYNQNDPQLKFLKEKMQELPAGWTIVAFAHIYWSGITDGVPAENVYGTQITDLIDSLYDDLNATFAALIVGHCHYDFSKNSTKGYTVISTTSDAYQLSDTALSPTMTLGTITEQAFDVFNIDTTNRKIYATRIGVGNDREFDY